MLVNGPIYTAVARGITVSIATSLGDLLEIRTPADCIIIPILAWVTTRDEETSQQVGVELGTHATAGTGGSGVTPEPGNQHLQASQCTVTRNRTVDATGTERNYVDEGANMLGAGWKWNGDGDIIVPISTSLVLGLASALTAEAVLSFGVKWMELGQ